ncbi:MAG TPA: amidohydrolase family protein [Edaphobacter sp.]|nr:amidohydrolase family protein [Edaphobacter sp.]
MAKRIDAHHHLWRYSREEYGWIDDEMAALRQNFLPEDLLLEMRSASIDGAVTVQARQTMEETRWLLDLADQNDEICGVVGWAPIADDHFPAVLEEISARSMLKGLRHVVQAEPDENFLLGENFNRGMRLLRESGLVYDILIYERQLPQTIQFVDRHPEQVFVLDHIGKPKIRKGEKEPWRTQIRELARRQNVSCKLSGLVTEADWKHWSLETLRPYLDAVVEAFGPKRVLVGSDWPVCLVACGYAHWFALLEQYFAGFSQAERDAIFGGNAERIYRL